MKKTKKIGTMLTPLPLLSDISDFLNFRLISRLGSNSDIFEP